MRVKIMHAMLLSSGELGYSKVTVGAVCERFGGSPAEFHAEFPGTTDCFRAAYEFEAERICRRLRQRIEQDGSCRERLEAAIVEMIELATHESAIARALFIEVHVAGGKALDAHREVMRCLARSIEATCEEAAQAPALTGEFIVGVIEQAIASSLARDALEELRQAIPELALILSRFYGDRAADTDT